MSSKCLRLLLVLTALLRFVLGDCQSWGWDFVDGGQNYFINTLDTAPFSFGTIFEGIFCAFVADEATLTNNRMYAR
jgi:hypothetical protein